ncbi:major facilitator superfamily domain-containing protein 10 isoform X1 [Anolis carolinensis]|uniref:Major facilitator superfamily domain-containing protein 10 n=1 Tax=Anolis carolinensis TaxID=28377 RepID=G1KVQ2_ANOCA|nr:PREDICTED: major facilitator superfamily domain-containing protein 10 [Anolis carolinensis]XP_008109518.1 PREDICTED: major facilitator superfamily domain-containing protein 10 [Anolis carolinensis]XP_008109519.1 PREDICTED: major facilitator superfamily domain-containing protein 10 [Anolis carolinensis]XP_008109520.1 PREDICTED: major facilitator superfamily domain-containing protein 10 [Anolis carolinensis]|eukprot:XP_003221431.1 PREDICTED: major facilitator superfamily domain-containing protein 10 [Anolis carolinensis]
MLREKYQENRRPLKESSGHEENSNRVITIVFVALLIDLLGFTLILPLLPSILDYYSKNDNGLYRNLQHGVDWFSEAIGMPPERKYNAVLFGGLIGSVFSMLQFFFSPLTGAASDCFGRRPVMLLTVIGLIASYFLWVISRSFELFLFSRIIGGISKGNVSLSTAIIADLQNPKARSKGMAMIGVAFSLGFTFGPTLGAYLAMEKEKGEIFYVKAATFAVMFAVTELAFIFMLLPETLSKEQRVSSVISGFQSAAHLISPLALFQFSAVNQRMESHSRENLKTLGLVYFMYLFLFSGLEYTLGFLVHQHFQFSSMEQGKMFFFIGISMAVIQGGYTRKIKPGNELKAAKMAILLLVPAFLLIGWSNNVIILSTGLFLYSFASAVVVPSLSTVVSGYGLISQKGTVMGILRSLGALARAVGPITAATVYWLAGAEVCFTVCASLFLLPFILLRSIQEQKKVE